MRRFSVRGYLVLQVAAAAVAGSAVAQDQPDPFADPTSPTLPSVPTADAARQVVRGVVCPELSEALCGKANTTFLAMCGGYILVAVVLALLLYTVLARRVWATTTARLLAAVLFAGVLAAVAVGLDPFQSDNYRCCLGDATFKAALLLGESIPARAVVLGLIPGAVLAFAAIKLRDAIARKR